MVMLVLDTEHLTVENKQQIRELHEQISKEKIKFPNLHGKTEDTIMLVIQHIEGGSLFDIMQYTDIPESTLRIKLPQLISKGKIEATNSYPKKYFIKGENYELKELLKNVKRR